jgi:hypothetical protein
MTTSGYKRLATVLGIVCVALLVFCGCLLWNYGWLTIRVAWASEQTEIFEEMRTKALETSAIGAAGYLDYAANYYPSGSKQETGSRLDRMVERERLRAIRDITSHIQSKSGQATGTNSQAWAERFPKR